MADDVVYKVSLDDTEVLRALKRIDANIDKLAADADKEFQKVGKSAQLSGVKIGAVSGVVGALTTKFIELGQRAVAALANVGKESVDLAGVLEVTEKQFTGIFQGNKTAALAALTSLREESRALGVDLTETAAAFLPFVSSLEQIERLGKIKVALELAQPEQKAQGGGRIALQEALSGDITSLVRRFEIPKSLAKELKKALDEGGVEAFLGKFEEVLKTLGRDLDTLGGGLQQAQGRAQIAGQQIQEAFGKPVVAELTEQFEALAKVVNENFDDIELIADTFGRVLANVVEIVGSGLTDFLANLDTEQVIEIAESFFDLVENAKDLAEVLVGIDFGSSFVDNLQFAVDSLNEALETAIKLSLLAQAEIAKQQAEQAALSEALGSGARRGAFGQISAGQASPEQAAAAAAAGEKAYNDVIKNGAAIIEESTKRKEDNRKATDDLAESQKKGTDAGLDEADAFLANAEAARALADAQEEATAAQAKIDEARGKAQKDYQQDLLEADIKFERARTDALLDGQRKRLDAAKQNLQRIADIEKKNKQGRTDSETDLDRDIEDIHRKHSREKIEQRKDEAQKIIDLETDTRRKIADIIGRSQIDLDEAEQRRDAVSFLRILKQRNLDIAEAQKDTARAVQDTRTEGERKREEQKIQQQQEIADARLANERRLEDLQTSLDRELEAQATAYEREREQIATNEQRKLDDLVLARERDREDALRHYQEKLADLELSMAAELETIKKFNAMEEEEAKRHAQAMKDAERQARQTKTQSQANADDDTPSSRPGAQNRRRQRAGQPNSRPGFQNCGRALGGPVSAGQPYLVGERGPELFQPNAAGKIIPSSALVLPSMTPRSTISNINNSRQVAADINLTDPSQLSPIQVAIVKNVVLDILNGLS